MTGTPRAVVLLDNRASARKGLWCGPGWGLLDPGLDVPCGDEAGDESEQSTDRATVLWQGARAIEEADLSPRARVLSTRSLGDGGDPRLVSDSKGDVAGVWGTAGVRPAGRAWCPRIGLRAAEDDWAVAIAPDGVAQVVWKHWPGGRRSNVILARTLRPCRAG